MAKVELSITANYQQHWGMWEGYREIVSNGMDAEMEDNARLTMGYKNSTLFVENEGTTIPHEALLLGHSTKMDRSDTIGQFGEGFKIGVLALVRAGHPVKIRNADEVWEAAIETSTKFKADVLVFNIAKGRKYENRVRVEIGNVDEYDWGKVQERFLRLSQIDPDDIVTVPAGSLLLSDKHKGRLYVKGVFIRNIPFAYGYDLSNVSINRDRDVVDSFSMNNALRHLWDQAVAARPDLLTTLYDMLAQGSPDVAGFDSWLTSDVSEHLKDALAVLFVEKFGASALPVENIGESRDAEHEGKHGVVVPDRLRALLEKRTGSVHDIRERLKNAVVKSYSWHELSPREKDLLECAIDDLYQVHEEASLDNIEIVDFHDGGTLGLFGSGKLKIARTQMKSMELLMRVLVHEFAHEFGGHCDKGFSDVVETTWAKLYVNARGRSGITVSV